MMHSIHRVVFLLIFLFLLVCGCMTEPPVKEPAVSVTEISLADVSLRSMTVNTTILVSNPNPVGANLNRLTFDLWYIANGPQYLGHGEQHEVDIRENGNTSITIPVTISNLQALKAIATLAEQDAITLMVNGSAFVDVAVTEYELPFEKSRELSASEFDAYLPLSSIAGIDVDEGIGIAKGLIAQIST